jgi:hypothetical protein
MLRSLVFTALLHVMPDEFGKLEQCPIDKGGRVITDVCDMIRDESWANPYDAVVEFAKRVTPADGEPGYLDRYADGLLAGDEVRARTTE